MLKDNFFYIKSISNEENNIIAELQLNPGHKIFEGHFPGQPVVPGVCQVQIIKEILETATGNNLQLKTADHIKFLAVIIPDHDSKIIATIKSSGTPDGLSVTATLSREDKICLKMKGIFLEKL
ncbi:MAG: 3-hydroxyacyl-ACP dehydratase [Chitinophagaceae bacterium]|nr:3-hydroxyacyl-ACP dehydratase [Chitinophagaceae bacterium]